jgi:hypothetical protein
VQNISCGTIDFQACFEQFNMNAGLRIDKPTDNPYYCKNPYGYNDPSGGPILSFVLS